MSRAAQRTAPRRPAPRGETGRRGTGPHGHRRKVTGTDGLGPLRTSVLCSDEERAPVLPWLSDAGDEEVLYVALHVHGSVAVRHDGSEVFLEPGDMVFCDAGLRDSPRFGNQFRMTLFRVPRRRLEVAESDLRRVMGVPLRCGEGMGALVSNFLSALASETAFHRSHIGDRLARNAVDLLAALVTGFVEGEQADSSGVGAQTLSRIRTFIELHLPDPDLSPESIALAHHISVRYLHKLFQSEGTTVSQLIRLRRLAACRYELGRAPDRRLAVAAVAHRWGFVSASHFSRVFRAAYGMSPSEWQASAWADSDVPVHGLSPGGHRRPEVVIASPVSGTTGPAAASKAWVTSGAVPSTSSRRALSS
ncbi:AraC family transcriptional regulator [Streptomyces atratus]|uniref:AraC family transcriptional regulator n=1 Tax=Streptomyces atratus TaxID=1893 RepID=A0A2Z5JLH0_STRAR|nr:AraC family transcriptional regulator [Streptomyces atratus]